MSRSLPGALGVFALALAIYGLTLAPGVFSWDSAELTLGIYTQGIVHATGYPLYLILGRLFTLLPLGGDFAARANLFSAVCGALTVALLYAIHLRLFGRPLIALAAALLFGFARDNWAQAVVAEVYALHTALVAGALLVVVKSLPLRLTAFASPNSERGNNTNTFRDNQTPFSSPEFGGGREGVYRIALLFGLALANHMAALLVAAVVLPYLLRRASWRARIITLALIGVTSALLYLYLPLRFAAAPEFNLIGHYFDRDLTQPGDLLWMVSGRMFGREMLAYPLLGWLGEILKFGGELWLNFLGVGLLLGMVGVLHLWQTRRTLCRLLGAVFAAQVLFFTSYDVFDKWTMFHTAYLVWAIFVAAGCARLLAALPRIAGVAFLALLVIAQIVGNWNTVGRAGDTFVADRSAALLAALPRQATLIAPWTTARPLEYAQIVDGARRDVQVVDVTLLALGERDRLDGDSAGLSQAVDARLESLIRCAPGPVFVVDPAILAADTYPVEYIQTGLYRVTGRPAGGC